MAKKGKTPKTQRRWEAPPVLRRLGRPMGWLLAIAALAVGWSAAERWLAGYVGKRRAGEPSVVLVDQPVWMGDRLQAKLQGTVGEVISPNPLDGEGLTRAARRLARNPWVEDVHRVRRRSPEKVTVHASYREPVALVRARDGFHLIDRKVRRLPGIYSREQLAKLDLPVIKGVEAPPPRQGKPWSGHDVRAGLKLALLIEGESFANEVQAIDVSNDRGRENPRDPHLTLVTDDGAVRWGRPPGEEKYYEPKPEEKLEHIRKLRERFGSIDAGGKVVDVYTDQVLIHPSGEGASLGYTGDS